MQVSYAEGSFEYSAAYGAYLESMDAARKAFLFRYGGDSGDESLPLYLLCGMALLMTAGAVFAHRKRVNVR